MSTLEDGPPTTSGQNLTVRDWVREHWFKVGILAILFLFGSFISYYVAIYAPKQDAAQSAARTASQSSMLQSCLTDASQHYRNRWASECRDYGMDYIGPNCKLPITHAENIEKWHQEERMECFTHYSRN